MSDKPSYFTFQALTMQMPYQQDPLQIYQNLCATKPFSLLLESAEIDSKLNVKSLLLIDAALRLVCRGDQVEIFALSENGQILLPWLEKEVRQLEQIEIQASDSTRLLLSFPHASTSVQDEDSRLRSVSNLDPLRLLQNQLKAEQPHPLSLFLGGVFGYDLIATFEPLPEVPAGANHCPDYEFYLAETLLVVDHKSKTSALYGSLFNTSERIREQLVERLGAIAARTQLGPHNAALSPSNSTQQSTLDVIASPSREEYQTVVANLQEHICAGDIFQVVPSRQFSLPCSSPLAAYAQLKQSNPSPYLFYLQSEDYVLFGASPESALKYAANNRQVELYPIAGTRPRGRYADGRVNPDLDSRIELDLRLDQKELAEHTMLVDLARNDLARIAKPGTRHVADLLKVDRYSQVMHLVSRVVATLADDLDALHAYRACMNMGTLVGAPKVSAANLIRQAEQQTRGSYGGAVGYLNGDGDMDTCIVIRSAFVSDGIAIVQAGAGVVFDSDPISETDETEAKARAVIHAIQRAQELTA